MNYRLFFEEVQECLAIAVFGLGTGAASLLFNENLRFKQRAEVVLAFINHPNLNRLDALVECRWIKIQAIPAGMKVCITMFAFIGDLYPVYHL